MLTRILTASAAAALLGACVPAQVVKPAPTTAKAEPLPPAPETPPEQLLAQAREKMAAQDLPSLRISCVCTEATMLLVISS